MPRRGDKPREPGLGVYWPGRRPVKTRRVFTGLMYKEEQAFAHLAEPAGSPFRSRVGCLTKFEEQKKFFGSGR
ncbi:helicase domain-containing protein [Methylocaldum marinum]|uniref:Helicase domain-containing protein n=1 Tax=Methylocaldum marinum TaxID=1432792 RepID=A0A286P4B1_9GAMM|nr:helicase domain-containing protein [Methylocaldum marinum]